MVSLYTISDKTLMGKKLDNLQNYICENFFKNNIYIDYQCVLSNNINFNENFLNSKSKIFLFLVDKANSELNNYLAKITNCDIIENPYIKNSIQEYYQKLKQAIPKEKEREFFIPALGRAIINNNNLTQCYVIEKNDIIYCVMPNDFFESQQIFDDVILNYVINNQKNKYKSYTFKTFGLTENGISQIINEELQNKEKVTINLFSKQFEVDIVIKSLEDNTKLDDIAKSVLLKLDSYIYAVEDVAIENVVYKMLKLNDIKICFVEDITGGALTYKLTKQAQDAKDFISASFILPTQDAKVEQFDINKKVLEENNGLSANLSYELAFKAINKTNSDIVVSVNGNLNGECFIAIGDKNEIHVYKNLFKCSHKELIESITTATYFYLIKKLKKNDFHFEKSTV